MRNKSKFGGSEKMNKPEVSSPMAVARKRGQA
jgi:hypothetical protein